MTDDTKAFWNAIGMVLICGLFTLLLLYLMVTPV